MPSVRHVSRNSPISPVPPSFGVYNSSPRRLDAGAQPQARPGLAPSGWLRKYCARSGHGEVARRWRARQAARLARGDRAPTRSRSSPLSLDTATISSASTSSGSSNISSSSRSTTMCCPVPSRRFSNRAGSSCWRGSRVRLSGPARSSMPAATFELAKMAVTPRYQGLHIGRRLLLEAIEQFKQDGGTGALPRVQPQARTGARPVRGPWLPARAAPGGLSHYQRSDVYMITLRTGVRIRTSRTRGRISPMAIGAPAAPR